MRFDFVVLGATGEEGSIASLDLLRSGYSVLMCGRNPARISKILKKHKKARFAYIDLSETSNAAKIIKKSKAKVVLNCAELRWNINAMRACLSANANYLDLGGLQQMTKEQYKLDAEFREKNLIALLGCGSTPGISNVMAACAASQLDSIERIDLGFAWDSNIKHFVLPYSFESIVHELTTPAIILKDGKLAQAKVCEFGGVKSFVKIGPQKIYCIVHSEVYTFYKYFKDKGLRDVHYWAGFPEHSFRIIELLVQLGYGSKIPVTVDGMQVRPVDFTRDALKRMKKPKNYREIEDVWVKVTGVKNNEKKIIEMGCLVETLKGWEDYGSNVDTGMVISILAQMVLNGYIDGNDIGVLAPEVVVPPYPFFKELISRGMKIYIGDKRMV